ncbi:MAG: hypothetical protein Q4B14_02555 [Clostridia bacterium]|nr:hypothetical protein [Clostridia bacterium]
MDIHSIRKMLRTKSIYDIPLRVTYYACVSSESDEQLNSLGNQITYYEDFIKRNMAWTFVPGYIDESLSIMSSIAQDELGKLFSRVKFGHQQAIKPGVPFSYGKNSLCTSGSRS